MTNILTRYNIMTFIITLYNIMTYITTIYIARIKCIASNDNNYTTWNINIQL